MTLKEKTVKSIGWVAFGEYTQLSVLFFTKIILARLLMPADFGVVALAYIVINGLKLFDNLGFGPAIIQRKNDIDKAANSAFFLLPCLGLFLTFICYTFSSVASEYFNDQTVKPVIQFLSIIFLLRSLYAVHQSLLIKELAYKKLFIVNIVSTLCDVTVVISMAIKGYGVWSLVGGQLTGNIFRTILMWIVSPFRPSFQFSFQISKELFDFSKHVLILTFIMYIYNNIDNFIIGKILSTSALGFYSVAYNLSNIGSQYFSSLFNRISFPVYSKIQNDLYKVKYVYLKFLSYSSLISIPFMIGMFILAHEMIQFVYGDKWLLAVLPLRVLCIFGMVRSIDTSVGHVYWGVGKPKISQQIGFVNLLIVTVIIYPLTQNFGIFGTAIAITLARIITMCLNFFVWTKIVHGRIYEIIKILFPPIFASTIMAVVLFFLKTHWLFETTILKFILLIGSGIFVYLGSIYVINRHLVIEVKELLKQSLSKKVAPQLAVVTNTASPSGSGARPWDDGAVWVVSSEAGGPDTTGVPAPTSHDR